VLRAIYHEFRRWAKTSGSFWVAFRRTEITLETDRIWVIRKSRTSRLWCPDCRREVDMVGLKEAAALSRKTQLPATQPTAQAMMPTAGDGQGWHWSQASDGSPLICLESLLRSR